MYTKEDFIEDIDFIKELGKKSEKCYEYLGENEITETFDEVYDKLVDNVIKLFPNDIEEEFYRWVYGDFYEEDVILETIEDHSILYEYLIK